MSKKIEHIPLEKKDKLDKMIQFLTGQSHSLPDRHKKLLELISYVDDQLRRSRSAQQIADLLRGKYSKTFSTASVYRYITYARYIFGTLRPIDKAYERSLLLDLSDRALRLAIIAGDYKFIGDHLAKRAKFLQLDVADEKETETYKPSNYQITISNPHGKSTTINLLNPKSISPEEGKLISNALLDSFNPESIENLIELQPPEPEQDDEE